MTDAGAQGKSLGLKGFATLHICFVNVLVATSEHAVGPSVDIACGSKPRMVETFGEPGIPHTSAAAAYGMEMYTDGEM